MPPDLTRLLKLQDLDTEIDQFSHRLENLPEQEELNSLLEETAVFKNKFDPAKTELDSLKKNQKRLEDEVASIEEVIKTYTSKIESNQITSTKELQDIASAVDARKDQQFKLEDEILNLMEEIEPQAEVFSSLEAEQNKLEKNVESLTEKIQLTTKNIKAKLDDLNLKRADAFKEIPENVGDIYEKLRSHHRGIGVAKLEGDKCQGCDINMVHPAGEIEALKSLPEDKVPQCSECQRILVISE